MLSTEKFVKPNSDFYVYTPSTLAAKLFLYPTIVGHFSYEPGYNLHRDSYDSFLCMYIKNGSCSVTSDGKTFTAGKGQIVLLDCYKPHSYSSDVAWDAFWFHFDGVQARDYYNEITANRNIVLSLGATYRFEKYIKKIYEVFKDSIPTADALLNSWIINIMTELMVNRAVLEKENIISDVIEDIISYITDNISENITLEQLAKKASLSPYYFSRQFKAETGFTPHDYILTAKINHAKYLLVSSQMSIKDICFNLGFNSESAFCIAFKKKVDATPSEYRSSNRL